MKFAEFENQVITLIDAERFEEAKALMKDHAVVVPDHLRSDPFQPPVIFKDDTPPHNMQEATMAIGVFTSLSRRLRNKKYQRDLAKEPDRLRILEEGDSWHQFPVVLTDLIDHIGERHAVHSLGYPGDTVQNMVQDGEFENSIRELDPDVFLFGGGGNDLLGQGRFSRVLLPYSQGASAVELIDEDAFVASFNRVLSGYRTVLTRAIAAKPSLRIFLHGYDHAIPRAGGKTLGQPLEDAGIPLEIGQQIVAIMINRFQRELDQLAADFAPLVAVFDMRGQIGGQASWFDELHPKSAGFGRCAATLMKALSDLEEDVQGLRSAGPAHVFEAAGVAMPGQGSASLYDQLVRRSTESNPFQRSPNPDHLRGIASQFSPEELEAQADMRDLLARFDEPEPRARVDARLSYSSLHRGGAFEAVIGTVDFDPYHVLPKGVEVARSVARITVRGRDGVRGFGTGFLIAPNLLLTNNHVLNSADLAATSIASFGYHENEDGSPNTPDQYRLTGDPFVTSVSHDYAIVGIEPVSLDGRPLTDFGQISMLPRSGKALKSEHVNIIQHPQGSFKQVALRKNLVVGRKAQFIYYTADTLPGSSGAPVFNTEWQLVGIHHMAIRDPDNAGQFLANRGIRISALMDDLNHRRGLGDSDALAVDRALFEVATEKFSLDVADTASIQQMEDPSFIDEEDGWEEVSNTASRPEDMDFESARPALDVDAARWPSQAKNAPDTWHIAEKCAHPFTLTAQVLSDLVSNGRYQPHDAGHSKVIVGLRGCQIAGGRNQFENVMRVDLEPTAVDHENTRCVIGVWDRSSGRLSVYTGSTVPRRTAMLKYYEKVNFGTSHVNCNMLPTGLYEYCVGSHFSRTRGEVTFVLRQGNGPLPAHSATVTTLRTFNDLTYGTQDFWDTCEPGDNIHPSFRNTSFSSQGCLTVPGHQPGGGAAHSAGTGLWTRFRKMAGFDGQRHGERYDLLLSTGHEASVAAQGSSVVCLRHGSMGDDVRRLQASLGVTTDGVFGPGTKKALSESQFQELGFTTGTWSAKMATLMGLSF